MPVARNVPSMLAPSECLAFRRGVPGGTITLETKEFNVLLRLFAAMHAYEAEPSFEGKAAVKEAYERADAYFKGVAYRKAREETRRKSR